MITVSSLCLNTVLTTNKVHIQVSIGDWEVYLSQTNTTFTVYRNHTTDNVNQILVGNHVGNVVGYASRQLHERVL